MSKITVMVTDVQKKETRKIKTDETVKVESPVGTVYVGFDENLGMIVLVHGEKSTTTVKFNDKAVV